MPGSGSEPARVSRETIRGPAAELIDACLAFDLELSPEQAGLLIAVLDRMALEPQNLTAIDGVADGIRRHLIDSLIATSLPAVRGALSLCDIGSGGGFPGVALAAALPACEVTLVESERRKAAWLVRASVPWPNVRVVADRSEDLARQARAKWDVVTARAVASLPVVLELSAPLIRDGGHLVAWRGAADTAEDAAGDRAATELGLVLDARVRVQPFPGARRQLDVWRKTRPTPDKYPRRPGRAAKRPIA